MHRRLSMVAIEDRTDEFRLSLLFNFECWVLFCNRGVRAPGSEDQIVVLYVCNVRCDLIARAVAKADDASVERLLEKIQQSGSPESHTARPAYSRNRVLGSDAGKDEN